MHHNNLTPYKKILNVLANGAHVDSLKGIFVRYSAVGWAMDNTEFEKYLDNTQGVYPVSHFRLSVNTPLDKLTPAVAFLYSQGYCDMVWWVHPKMSHTENNFKWKLYHG